MVECDDELAAWLQAVLVGHELDHVGDVLKALLDEEKLPKADLTRVLQAVLSENIRWSETVQVETELKLRSCITRGR